LLSVARLLRLLLPLLLIDFFSLNDLHEWQAPRLTPRPRGELETNQDLCMLDQGTASFWVEGVRALFPVDLQEQPMWLSTEGAAVGRHSSLPAGQAISESNA
jgi:hypothetical protein